MRRDYREVTLAVEDYHWWYRGRRNVVGSVLATLPLPTPARSLDAGCGGGASLPGLAALGTVVGLEPSAHALAAARERAVGTVVEGVVESIPFEDGEFDLAIALDVIEHLEDDRAGFRELRRAVRPGGFLVATVPAYPRLFGPHDVVNEHRRRYLRHTLIEAAAPEGWLPLSVTHFNSVLLPAAALRRIRDRRRPAGHTRSDFERTPPWLNGPLEWPLRLEARAIAAGVRLPAGLSILGVFKADTTSSSENMAE